MESIVDFYGRTTLACNRTLRDVFFEAVAVCRTVFTGKQSENIYCRVIRERNGLWSVNTVN